MISNDNTPLEPSTRFTGSALEFDFSGFQIGGAEYEAGPTGCAVFYFPHGAAAAETAWDAVLSIVAAR
jgi:hypothetical protein